MKIALTTDHAGFDALRKLEKFLTQEGHVCINYGPTVYNPADDYPDFIYPAAEAVSKGEVEAAVIMGGSGQGEAMVANRLKGVRAAVYYGKATPTGALDADGSEATDDLEILRLSRQHNLANVLSLGARFLTWIDIQEAVMTWLETPYGDGERHMRRVTKIDQKG